MLIRKEPKQQQFAPARATKVPSPCCLVVWKGDGLKEYVKLCPPILVYSGNENDTVAAWDKAVQP